MRRSDEALTSFGRALELQPAYLKPLIASGVALEGQGRLEEAVGFYRRALALQREDPDILSALALALAAQGRSDEAESHLRRAVECRPDSPDTRYNLGYVLQWRGELDDAIACYDEVLRARPGFGEALWGRALSLLAKGDYARGWREYEARYLERLVSPVTVRPDFEFPMWRGESLSGKRILVVGEQGYGDQIQFVRYAAMLAGRGAEVDVLADDPVKRLFLSVPGVRQVIPGVARNSADYDRWILMMSLPLRFATLVETIPRDVPYLQPPQEDVRKWAERLQALPQGRLKVGLVWAGKPGYGLDRFRSMPFSALAPLGRVPDVSYVSLQTGAPGAEIRSEAPGLPVLDLAGEMRDFADTAALLANLDLLLAVDTAFAHLAGALARPVWLLQSSRPDWRWMVGRSDSPWYPTMRLMRQSQLGDWGPVVERAAAELDAVARRPRGAA